MAADPSDTPTIADLRAIAEFIRIRSLDEAGAAGRMGFYRQSGVTLQVRLPKDMPGDPAWHRANVREWLDGHPPDRFMNMANEMAHMADGLADVLNDVPEMLAPYRARALWRRLARAARLWESHPDFNPAWAEQERDGS